MYTLSEIALNNSASVIQAIKEHPFNRELAAGTLALEKFAYYIEQDALYLQDFARSLARIAARAPSQFINDFLLFSKGALIAEQEVVHHFFRETFHLHETGRLTSSTLSYTNFLLQTSSSASVEVAIAAVLPCFWIYQIVGQSIAENTVNNTSNPYWRWIETYSSEEFGVSVQKAITIFDEIASSSSEATRNAMLNAFYKSAVLEWHFWNDSYHLESFDSLI